VRQVGAVPAWWEQRGERQAVGGPSRWRGTEQTRCERGRWWRCGSAPFVVAAVVDLGRAIWRPGPGSLAARAGLFRGGHPRRPGLFGDPWWSRRGLGVGPLPSGVELATVTVWGRGGGGRSFVVCGGGGGVLPLLGCRHDAGGGHCGRGGVAYPSPPPLAHRQVTRGLGPLPIVHTWGWYRQQEEATVVRLGSRHERASWTARSPAGAAESGVGCRRSPPWAIPWGRADR